jgi:NAD(P)-dependent dehydrogenase (short-subunit alcohol dehydrogenase family)
MADSAGRVVVVTGASSGIGKACALHLARAGYRVFGAQRRTPASETGGVEMVRMDVTDEDSVRAAIATIHERAGRIDAVINNAGDSIMGAVEDTSIEEAKAQLDTNFFGVLRVCRAVLPIMRAQGGGYIINIGSLAGVQGLPFHGLYAASKFALEGMSESLRFETRRYGIKVVVVEPGDFDTALPAARRSVAAAGVSSAYRDAFERSKLQQEKDVTGAPTPEPVARLVERILQMRNPPTRCSVGMLSQRIVVPLKRLLPQRLYEQALIRVLGL